MSLKILGDPHLGRPFINGVPLHRRGEREAMQRRDFEASFQNLGDTEFHVCMGDLFDKATVSYDWILYAAEVYLEAAAANPGVTFVILKGNHDWTRDLERKSAFDVFAAIVSARSNIWIVGTVRQVGDFAFFAWHPTISPQEMVAKMQPGPTKAFGHWDLDFGTYLLPEAELKAAGVERVYNGHIHKPEDRGFVYVIGSMQPYAHGEELDEDLYVTRMITDLDPSEDFSGKCLRVLGGIPDFEIDCLQLTIKKEAADDDELDLSVSLGDFDMEGLFQQACADTGVAAEFTYRALEEFQARRAGVVTGG